MKRYLLDTGIASDYVNRRLGVYDTGRAAVARGDRIGIGTPVLGELWAGIHWSQTRDRNEKRLRHHLSHFRIWPFDEGAAEEFGRIYAELRHLGRPMQQIDAQTAAIALTLADCTVVSKDADLKAVPGLTVVDWSAE